jgi:MoaA/NifB/PqqE/SkfB family radical SAM enzyme
VSATGPNPVPRAEATPRPDEGVVSFNVNTACNYRCSYCTQRFKDDRGRWARDTERFLAAFARLPGRWEVKLSGGEPFVHPTLVELVSGLAEQGHRVGFVTNFSAKPELLERVLVAARGRVSVFSVSLHLEYVPHVNVFAEKAARVRERLLELADASLPTPSLHVTTVATREALPRLQELRAAFVARGLVFKVQPEKQEREVIDYTPSEKRQLRVFGGHNLMGSIAPSYEGLPCWAGSRYFILDDEGVAYRCYPARRYRVERMGNFLADDFRLADEPALCRYRYCNCTVPIARRMMPRDAGLDAMGSEDA